MIIVKVATLFVTFVAINAGTDKTLSDKEVGEEVVEAVVDLITKSKIFADDHRFLLRLAYMESEFGSGKDTFTRSGQPYDGGIWQVDQDTFLNIQKSTNQALKDLQTKIMQIFKLDWSKLTWADCRKPLVSALAARLSLPEPVPDTLESQADYWTKSYNSANIKGTAQDYIARTKVMEKRNKCHGRMDLVLVMDGSGSIGVDNFNLAKKFVADLIGTFSLDSVNLGYVLFSEDAQVIIPMDSGLSLADMQAKVQGTAYPNAGTQTGVAIQASIKLLQSASHREGSPRIMVVFTDGNPSNPADVPGAVAAARAQAITMFAVGIGSGINQPELDLIAANDHTHVFPMSSYQQLSESFEMMNTQTCKIPGTPDIGKKINDTLIKDEKRYFCYHLDIDGITVTIDVEVGKTEGYYSYKLENPTSALNDGLIGDKTYIADTRDNSTQRVCITIKGIDVINNFTINSDKGDKTDNDIDDPLTIIKNKAKEIAIDEIHNDKDKNYIHIADEICNRLSEMYSKEEWICVVGEKVQVSEHVKAGDQMFQFGFKVDQTEVYIIVKMPGDDCGN